MKTKDIYIESAAQTAAIIRVELPKRPKEERVFVLTLDSQAGRSPSRFSFQPGIRTV